MESGGEKSMYGRKFLGIIRTTVLVGPGRQDSADLAQCEGRRTRRGGSRRRPIGLIRRESIFRKLTMRGSKSAPELSSPPVFAASCGRMLMSYRTNHQADHSYYQPHDHARPHVRRPAPLLAQAPSPPAKNGYTMHPVRDLDAQPKIRILRTPTSVASFTNAPTSPRLTMR